MNRTIRASLSVLALLAASTTSASAEPDRADAHAPSRAAPAQIRVYGFGMGGVVEKWEAGFRQLRPETVFDNTLPTSDAAIPGLVTRVADLGVDGGEPALTEDLSFFETRGYHPSQVVVASGAYDLEGRSNGPVVFVNAHNPLTHLTIDQLDGIFGSERNGGLRGFVWTPLDARGPEKNLRTWGQLGLKGKWADKPIQTYGHGPSGTTRFFQLKVLAGTDKWNPNYRGYVETGSKQIAPEDRAQQLGARSMLQNELAHNPYGIAWTIMSQAKGIAGIRAIALAPRAGGPAVTPSAASFQARSYPLVRNIYIYFDRAPGKPVEPKLAAFLRYVLSPEGQAMVAAAGYLPLPPSVASEQLRSLD